MSGELPMDRAWLLDIGTRLTRIVREEREKTVATRESGLRFETTEAAQAAATILEEKGIEFEVEGTDLNLTHEGALSQYTGAIYPRDGRSGADIPALTGAEILYFDEPTA